MLKKQPDDFFIVGIGASAGGIGALESFFSGMPIDDINMAFVIVQHLDPNHKSLLTQIVQRYTNMKVYEVEDGMHIQINHVYIIPPNCNMKLSHGTLYLVKPSGVKGPRLAVDFFFHSLGEDKQNKAIGIVLSGTGHDGRDGIIAIKEAGGIAIAQNTESTEFDEMPESAIATGLLDDVLPPNEMPDELIRYASGKLTKQTAVHLVAYDKETLEKIFFLLQKQTSHDFSMYKPSTIGRRIERRLVVNKIESIQEYYKYLQRSTNEVQTLFKDLLIGVTHFFRDEEVFLVLEKK